MSDKPKSTKPSSKAPKADEVSDKKAKSNYASIPEDLDSNEEYDDFEELPTASNYPELGSPSKKPQSRVPSKSVYHDAKSSIPEDSKDKKQRSVMQSALFKDDDKSSKARSVMQSALFKDDDKSSKVKSVMQSALFRDDAKFKPKSVMASMLFKDEQPFKSFIVTKEDKIMSQRQTKFASLAPKEQKKQEEWAQEKIKDIGACPEQYQWLRVDQGEWGGYMCAEGRHAMSDAHIAEGLGAIIVLGKMKNFGNEGAQRYGPWYPHPVIMNAYVYVEGKDVDGIKPYNQPAFLGSAHQVERAKWEYYTENPEDAVFMKYKQPDTEPPEEWAFENSVPKAKDSKKNRC